MELKQIFKVIIKKLEGKYFLYENSFHLKNKKIFFLCRNKNKKFFGELNYKKNFIFKDTPENTYEFSIGNKSIYIALFDTSIENSKKLVSIFKNLTPSIANNKVTFGFGDRLGIATAYHVEISENYRIFPYFAQQSVREILKTKRTCEEVLNNTFIGIFQNNYQGNWGADADHIRDEKWLKIMLNNNFLPYTMFTIDTYDFINENLNDPIIDFEDNNNFKIRLNKSKRYISKSLDCFGYKYTYDEDNIYHIVKRYYKSLDFLLRCFKIIKSKFSEFGFEPTFDERDDVTTSPEDHFYLASELINDGINFTTFAPKFPGLFHKGIDYDGNVKNFNYFIKIHKKIVGHFGCYSLSLHSADDKFKILKSFSDIVGDKFHIKTSGTTWMEGLRTIAEFNPDLFKKILELIKENPESDCKAYYIELAHNKIINLLKTKKLVDLIDIKETRQLLHVSYGTILAKFKKEIIYTLFAYEDKYSNNIINNYKKHFEKIFS